jgi:hypothetical protein
LDRRDFVKRAAASTSLALAFKIGASSVLLSPREARAERIPLQSLDEEQAKVIEAFAEFIVPGCTEAGLVHFIDHQLNEDPDDCMLILKFFGLPPPYLDFYVSGLDTISKLSEQRYKKPVLQLEQNELAKIAEYVATPDRVSDDGYPLFLFYMCLRSDAVDMVYGTPRGFEKLNIPYMAHIEPPEGWNG